MRVTSGIGMCGSVLDSGFGNGRSGLNFIQRMLLQGSGLHFGIVETIKIGKSFRKQCKSKD
jgi:hypothetical protein